MWRGGCGVVGEERVIEQADAHVALMHEREEEMWQDEGAHDKRARVRMLGVIAERVDDERIGDRVG